VNDRKCRKRLELKIRLQPISSVFNYKTLSQFELNNYRSSIQNIVSTVLHYCLVRSLAPEKIGFYTRRVQGFAAGSETVALLLRLASIVSYR
jgi:hypothetical protein